LQSLSLIYKLASIAHCQRHSLLCLGLWLATSPLLADNANVEYKIKAGYLYNFTKFINWPSDNEKTFNLCILGDDPFGDLINPIEKRTALGRPIKLFRFSHSLKAGQHCHILYIHSISLKSALGSHATSPILTVGESEDFVSQGGMIRFISRQDKIKLQINLAVFQKNGLIISAKLLEVAEIIGSAP
jgi:hypothetical protein